MLPARLVGTIAGVLRPLFSPLIVAAILGIVAAVDWWLLIGNDVGRDARQLVYRPGMLLLVLGLTLVSGVFHEVGHATASRYGGARPGAIGIGIYLMWPAFYNDLNDSYRLSRRARLRADLGGVYFNCIFVIGLAGAYAATGLKPLVVTILVQHIAVAQQFLPFLRLDGYYIVSDLAGVPNLFGYVRPTLAALVRPRRRPSALAELTRPARAIVVAWVVATVIVLAALTVVFVVQLPALVAALWHAVGIRSAGLTGAVGDGALVRASLSGIELVIAAIPVLGLMVMLVRTVGLFGRLARGFGRRSRRWSDVVSCRHPASGVQPRRRPPGETDGDRQGSRCTV